MFPEFVFDFLHCNLPFAHGDWQRFFCKLFASGNGKHGTSTTFYTVRMTKTATAKIVCTCFAKATKFAFFPSLFLIFCTEVYLCHRGWQRFFLLQIVCLR